MSEPDGIAAPQPRRRGPAIGRFLLTVLIFLLLGPLVGGVVAILGLTFGTFAGSLADMAIVALGMAIYGLWVAYPLGAPFAILVGVIIALRDLQGGTSWRFALLVGALAGIAFLVAAFGANSLRADDGSYQITITVSFFAASLIATLACFGATRGLQPRQS